MKYYKTSITQLAKEIEIKAIKSSGPGGQHVNKSSTAIQIYHIPSGIRIKVSDTRSQYQNKQLGLQRLQQKLKKFNEKLKETEKKKNFKKRTKKIPKKEKEKRLKNKKRVSEKKKLRGKVREYND